MTTWTKRWDKGIARAHCADRYAKLQLFEMRCAEQHVAEASERKSQVGSGDRSERMEQVMEGLLEELIEPLQQHDQAEKLKTLKG